jgi:hypothetical protein
MQQTQLDRELAAYLRGRRDEMKDTYQVLEVVRRLGFIDLDTAATIIDYLAKVDRRANEIPRDDGE